MNFPPPHIIQFGQIGESAIGFISVAEKEILPFTVKRVYWTYFTPDNVTRGRHAHKYTEQILIAASGRIIITTENLKKEKLSFTLESPQFGLYIPPGVWHNMQYNHYSTQLTLASTEFDEEDYIRDYEVFKSMQ